MSGMQAARCALLGLDLLVAASGCDERESRAAEKAAPVADAPALAAKAPARAMETETNQSDREGATVETAKAMFGAGCFWGVEAAFRKIEGVTSTAVGYAGGEVENPTYKQVCTDRTGHAEVVLVEYDPSNVSYEQLLNVFWHKHDPTQLNRQGPDVGNQYRSVIFTFTPEQAKAAEASKKALAASGKCSHPIVTTIEDAPPFYRAEDYHQQYLEKRGLESCSTTVGP